MKKALLLLAIAAALLAGCGQKQQQTGEAPKPAPSAAAAPMQLPPGHPEVATTSQAPAPAQAAAPPQMAPVATNQLRGKLLESMDAAGYTYLRIKTDSGEQWAAVRETKVKKGDVVTVNAQMTMNGFESKTLKRKFDSIVFGTMGGANDAPPASMASAAPAQPAANPMGTAVQHMTAGAANVGDVKVDKAPNGKSVAETFAAKNELKDKPVVIRGKVVKFLSGIMGKNWLHLRDGSGSGDKGDNDI
ncbi:MAG TPA: hypothetical protein VGR95_18860, partial [Thermoanaerobaculia bacterium]|nr:hypothetical protein [Thermoanaerobaculia bacterium]